MQKNNGVLTPANGRRKKEKTRKEEEERRSFLPSAQRQKYTQIRRGLAPRP
jgi:hypothetical protein